MALQVDVAIKSAYVQRSKRDLFKFLLRFYIIVLATCHQRIGLDKYIFLNQNVFLLSLINTKSNIPVIDLLLF